MLLVVMTLVPLTMITSLPPASAWGTKTTTTTTAPATTFSGRAFVASVTEFGGATQYYFDTGPLPPSGGTIDATAVSMSPVPFVTVEGLVAVTMGSDSTAESMASAGTLQIASLPGGAEGVISADSLTAQSKATCTNGVVTLTGSSSVSGLMVGTQSITGSTPQVISGPGFTIYVNQQITTSNSVTFNALHIITTDPLGNTVIDITIASAESDINCAAPCPHMEHDFETGGGWIQQDDGNKGTFGNVAGYKDVSCTEDDTTQPSGHITYDDHSNDKKVQSTDVQTYSIDAPNQRTYTGDANLNGVPGYTYSVTVQDNGEPGAGVDTFSISVWDSFSNPVYSTSGTLGGGNIEIHN